MLVHLKTLLTNVEFELTTPKIKNYMLYLTEPARCPVGLLTVYCDPESLYRTR